MRHVTPENRVINFVPPSTPTDGLITASGKRTVERLLGPCPYFKKAWHSADGSAIDRDPLDE
jgi:hypothetical protein